MSVEDGGAPQGPTSSAVDTPSAIGSATTEQHIDLRDLASALAPTPVVSASIIKGVVTAVALTAAPPTITVQVSGDASVDIPGVRFIDSYSPVTGDTVLMVKQGAQFFALGQMNETTAEPSENGWVTPSLGSGITTHSIDPVRYRVVIRDGDRVVQLRGGVTLSGSQTALWTMPAAVRPVVNLLPLLCARNPDGGSAVAQLQVNQNGTMVLAAATTGVTGTASSGGGAQTGSDGDGNTGSSIVNFNHNHKFLNLEWGTTDEYRNADSGNKNNANSSHSHSVPSHSHTMTNHIHAMNSVEHPDWLSFNGIEYIL